MFLIIAMLSLSSLDKDKDAVSSLVQAVVLLSMMSSVPEVAEDVLLMVLEEEAATVTLRQTDSNMSTLKMIISVKILMVKTMLDFLAYKPMEEVLEASVSLVPLVQVHQVLLPVSASSTLARVLDPVLNFM